jgi:tRNA pseudouridine55 synthase
VAVEGLLIVDKPAGLTSHDVVARVRRLAGTRRVGHAGTLDPLATGVLVLGLGRATRLLGHLSRHDKDYTAGICLGVSTDTDDADGRVVATSDTPWDVDGLEKAMSSLVGEISQVPPAHSALKVDGKRAYTRARAGEDVALAPRTVTVEKFALQSISDQVVEVAVTCSSGTYVRALARDLGALLGTGGHLVSLRRTRVGAYGLAGASRLDELETQAPALPAVPLPDAVRDAFPIRVLDAEEAVRITFGRRLAPTGVPGVHGAFGPDGGLLALVEDRDELARPVLVFEAH